MRTTEQSVGQNERAHHKRRSVVLALVLATPLFLIACPKNSGPESPRGGMSARPQPEPSIPIPGAIAFNGERALDHVRKQLEFGPRPPGSPELAKTREYISNELKKLGLSVTSDEFRATTPQGDKNMANLTAEIPGESKDVIIIASHYDTKYYKNVTFVGANDPGTSVGTVLELARVLSATRQQQKPKFTYWFVFFDGEESICEDWNECGKPGAPDNTYGSRHYVAQLDARNERDRVRALILLDMMGHKDLQLSRDETSTKWLVDTIWQTARELGYGSQFVNQTQQVGGDDYDPFLHKGIESVDLIQFFPQWHRADDTLENVSARSMKIVGDVVLASLPRIEQHLLNKR
jgi:glutaminyl-peptide cyclotransferase